MMLSTDVTRKPVFGRAVSPGQAGGLPEISRWLSEALRATPPDIIADKNRIPRGCQKPTPHVSGIPPGCGGFYVGFRWCRSRCDLNHRLISGKPPACPDAIAKEQEILPTDVTQLAGPDLVSGRARVGGHTGNSRPDTRSGPTKFIGYVTSVTNRCHAAGRFCRPSPPRHLRTTSAPLPSPPLSHHRDLLPAPNNNTRK
jgi:hypothetical protein